MRLRLIKKEMKNIDLKLEEEINSFISQNGGLIFHETDFNKILSRYINSDLLYYLVLKENSLVALAPVQRRKKGLLNEYYSGILDFEIPYGGWVFGNGTNINVLMSLIKPIGFASFYYYSSVDINNVYSNIRGFKYWTSIIDLKKNSEDIWDSMIDSKRRNMIRKAKKNGIQISFHGPEAINSLYKLLIDMNKRTGMVSKNKSFYKQIIEKYYANGKAHILLAKRNGAVISGVFLLGNNYMMHYWQGASALNAGNFGQSELLQWEAIKWCNQNSIMYYDLCYLYSQKQLDGKDEKQLRIAQFKMGFSKELVPFYCITKKSFPFRVINKIQNVFLN